MDKKIYLIYDINGQRVHLGDTVEQVKPQVVQIEGTPFENYKWKLTETENGVEFVGGKGEHCSIAFAAPFKHVEFGEEL